MGVGIVTDRFSDEGEPAMLYIEGDREPSVFRAIDEFRQNSNLKTKGVVDKMTRTLMVLLTSWQSMNSSWLHLHL